MYERYPSAISGITAGLGMSILQILYALYWLSSIYNRDNFVAQIFLPGSILLWVVVFAFAGSFATKHQGSGALAGLWAGLSGSTFSSIWLLISLRIVYPVFIAGLLADSSIIVLLFLFVLLILVILGTLFGFLGGVRK